MSDFLDLGAIDFGATPAFDINAVAENYNPAVDAGAYGLNYINPVTPATPSWLQSLGGAWTNAAQGIMTGVGQVATGMNQALPNLLIGSLASKVGLTARTVPDANGQSVTYIQPAQSGVPAAGPTAVTVGGTSMTVPTGGGLSIATIVLIAGLGLAAILLLRGK